jgi:hypothetical protein
MAKLFGDCCLLIASADCSRPKNPSTVAEFAKI